MRLVVKMIVESDDGSVASEGEVLRLERDTQSMPGHLARWHWHLPTDRIQNCNI